MRKNRLLLLASFTILFTGCSMSAPAPKPEDLSNEAKALDARFIQALNKGDVEGVMSTYWNSPDTVLYPPDQMEAKGWTNFGTVFSRS